MKNILVIFLFVSISAFSQSNAEDKLMDKLCKESCDALNKENFSSGNKDDMTTKLGFVLIGVYNKNSNEIKKVFGYDVTSPEDAQKMGQKLGAVLVFKCPKFKDIVFKMTQTEDLGNGEEKESLMENVSVSGFIEKIDCNELCSFSVKTQDGEKLKIYRMEKFPGSEFLDTFNGAKSLNRVEVLYKPINIYLGTIKNYQTIKVVTRINY